MPLTLRFVEQCYQECSFGFEEPTQMAMSDRRKKELCDLMMAMPRNKENYALTKRLIFNNAEVISRPQFGDDIINFVNAFRPGDLKLNRTFEIK